MKLMFKMAIGIVVLLAIPVGFVALLFFNSADMMCGNYVHEEYLSPQKHHKAVVFQRDCGATTGFSTQISIISGGETLGNGGGNIYVIAGHPEKVAPNIEWLSDDKLLIKRALNGSEYKAKTSWGWFTKIGVEYGAGGS